MEQYENFLRQARNIGDYKVLPAIGDVLLASGYNVP